MDVNILYLAHTGWVLSDHLSEAFDRAFETKSIKIKVEVNWLLTKLVKAFGVSFQEDLSSLEVDEVKGVSGNWGSVTCSHEDYTTRLEGVLPDLDSNLGGKFSEPRKFCGSHGRGGCVDLRRRGKCLDGVGRHSAVNSTDLSI